MMIQKKIHSDEKEDENDYSHMRHSAYESEKSHKTIPNPLTKFKFIK